MTSRGEQAMITLTATGIGAVVAYCLLLVIAVRLRLEPVAARVVRAALATIGSGIISVVGWIFFMFGMHRPTPIQTLIAWLGVPFVQLVVARDWPVSNLSVWSSLLTGVAAWATVLYAALYVVRIPGERRAESPSGLY